MCIPEFNSPFTPSRRHLVRFVVPAATKPNRLRTETVPDGEVAASAEFFGSRLPAPPSASALAVRSPLAHHRDPSARTPIRVAGHDRRFGCRAGLEPTCTQEALIIRRARFRKPSAPKAPKSFTTQVRNLRPAREDARHDRARPGGALDAEEIVAIRRHVASLFAEICRVATGVVPWFCGPGRRRPEGSRPGAIGAPGRIRTCVEGIRSPSPDPLGHGG